MKTCTTCGTEIYRRNKSGLCRVCIAYDPAMREKRQAGFKEKIGSITVKMTGVMVLTLLPALLVITAGPGFMAVIRSLSSMGGR